MNYIHGKKVFSSRRISDFPARFHYSLNNGGFNLQNFKLYIDHKDIDDLENKIIELLFPKGVLDETNWAFIKQLYLDGAENNNLYSKGKSKKLIIKRFNELKRFPNFNLSFDSWKILVSSPDFEKWDDDIFRLTNDFAELIINEKDRFRTFISTQVEKEKILEKKGETSAVLEDDRYRKENNILKDIADILSNKFLHLPSEDMDELQKEKKFRISYYRELIKDLKLPAYHLRSFIYLFGPSMKSYKDYSSYESSILDIYPLERREFDNIDNELFKELSADFVFLVDSRKKGKSN